jgi:hypothetical protein
MEAAEVTSRQPDDGEVATPIPRFVVIVGDSADDGAALRVENPARLLRVWSLLRATRQLLDSSRRRRRCHSWRSTASTTRSSSRGTGPGRGNFTPITATSHCPAQGYQTNPTWGSCAGPLTQAFIEQASLTHLDTSCLANIPALVFDLTLP